MRADREVPGAWHWVTDKHVRFRPKTCWPAEPRCANVAHGCIGLSLTNAKTYHQYAGYGDIVEVEGTGHRPFRPGAPR